MTDQTPATEAGRRLLDALMPVPVYDDVLIEQHGIDIPDSIIAIEAEARADAWNEGYRAGYSIGRADALREAAEAVRALAAPKYDGNTWTKDCEHGWETHAAAVLAILQERQP